MVNGIRLDFSNAVEVFGMLFGKPFDERSAGVQSEFDGIVALENVEKGKVTFLIGLLQDVPKVADGLVIMNGKNETYPVHEGDISTDCKKRYRIIGRL